MNNNRTSKNGNQFRVLWFIAADSLSWLTIDSCVSSAEDILAYCLEQNIQKSMDEAFTKLH